MWCHSSTGFKRHHSLRIVAVTLLTVALLTMLLFSHVANAVPGGNKTLSFQGRLSYSTGGNVPDGRYNIQFKMYQGGTGTAAGNPSGSLEWTETYINNGGANGIEVKGGYFSVNLGSLNPFGSSVDWDDDTLWISMNVAGSATGCTSYGSAPCAADGEMLPMKRITATPYALNAGQLGGKTASNFVQLAQGVQADASTNTSSIHINKTGSGNLVQLQNAGTDIFTINDNGDITLGNVGDKTVSVATAEADTAGGILTIAAGNGGAGTGANGGDLVLQGGHAGGTDGNGGVVVIDSGNGTGGGGAGTIYIGSSNDAGIQIGSTNLGGGTQAIVIGTNENSGGATNVTVGSGGDSGGGWTRIQGKEFITIATDGVDRATFTNANTVHFGNGVSASAPDNFTLQGTNSTANDVAGGSLAIQGGDATTGDADGGNVTISGGTASGAGVNGLVVLTTPTFSTVTNDSNCYTGGGLVSSSCTVALSTVNNASAAIVGFDAAGQTATLPDPTLGTPGRVFYVMAAGDSEELTLLINSSNEITLPANAAVTLIWNGSDWAVAGLSGSAFQNFAMQGGGGEEFMMMSFSGDELTVDEGGESELNSGEESQVTETQETPATSTPSEPAPSDNLTHLNKNASAPTGDPETLLGSMYYDTSLGKVQCYEAEGWGMCGASPDSFITISPEYSNAVMNGTDIGTISSDLCSDTLNINDGSPNQPAICGINETYNYYKWTSAEDEKQTRSIFVTYKLPASFNKFVPDSTYLMGKTDHDNSEVSYQVYRDNSNGLTACGGEILVSNGVHTTWQQAKASKDDADPASCDFEPGDSMLIRINLSAKEDASAYVSNLNFAFTNK